MRKWGSETSIARFESLVKIDTSPVTWLPYVTGANQPVQLRSHQLTRYFKLHLVAELQVGAKLPRLTEAQWTRTLKGLLATCAYLSPSDARQRTRS